MSEDMHLTEERFIEICVERCNCCPECYQQIPCHGVLAGGLCDDICDCDEEKRYQSHLDVWAEKDI